MSELIKVPDIGGEGEVIEILIKEGDTVEPEQSLVVVESDKASMEIPSPKAGVVKSIKVKIGDTLKEGAELIELESADSAQQAEGEDAASGGDDKPVDEAEEAVADDAESKPSPAETVTEADSSAIREVKIPDIGENAAKIIEILVKPGDSVEKEQSLLVLESDKASMEIPAPFDGVVESVDAKLEQDVKTGDLIMHLRTADGESKPSENTSKQGEGAGSSGSADKPAVAKPDDKPAGAAPGYADKGSEASTERPEPPPVGGPSRDGKKVHAGPATRQLAREFGVDLAQVPPSGPKDRILKEDVQNFVKETLKGSGPQAAAPGGGGIPPVPEIDFSRFGEVEVRDMTRLQQAGAVNIHRSWLNVPHVTQFDLADIGELEAFRKEQKAAAEKAGVKLTVLPFLLKACAHLLREQPHFNVSLAANGKQLVHKQYVHIGFAVDTPDGLLVPVIRDVDKKSLLQLAGEAAELADRARNKKLGSDAMQGACFTISSLGHIGGTYFTPIVNAPEVAILGVSRASMQPVWDGSTFQPRLMLPLSLSYDHRAINGAAAAQFTRRLGELLGDIRTMLL
ncbi:dihydrolipoyllysine-residue acetyltransferase [Halopseudomonas nanhaiensis]|uniref:dihydrolipoyllysine-residue acetyltransferase n=1 Tax=Halopseudomonas nanhaiensis TaxID=2830842 RepID=UPI001CBB7B6D|nr:dihydrolipoyllysine-residue acetyltransferase [Halopseudomonas nanhaiensis]UAW99082.1 dihydrolipoyllysine-residue acetyltransferase [Halopseudomonas nanhaiensis]